jgi:hypothetical protein
MPARDRQRGARRKHPGVGALGNEEKREKPSYDEQVLAHTQIAPKNEKSASSIEAWQKCQDVDPPSCLVPRGGTNFRGGSSDRGFAGYAAIIGRDRAWDQRG